MIYWSMDSLAEGTALNADEILEPIAVDTEAGVKWTFPLLFGQNDSEQVTCGWGMTSYNEGDEVCGFCLANRSDLPFTDAHTSAK